MSALLALTGLLFVSLLLVPPARAETAAVVGDAPACGKDQVSVVVDFNELGGATRTACVSGPGTAAKLFGRAHIELQTANAPNMQGFVCRVQGRPATGPCTRNDSYWSLWWAEGTDSTWSYASLGASNLELEPGSYVGFAWHQGSGSASPPDLSIGDDGRLQPEKDEQTSAPPVEKQSESDGPPVWLLAGGAVVLLGAAGAVPILRRRSRESS
ncbi:MAG: hypothetical protein L0H31_02215 [Nocardioidaceae bacterium]|nr:hypothetical protein [Nocardioidaceae bacterium]